MGLERTPFSQFQSKGCRYGGASHAFSDVAAKDRYEVGADAQVAPVLACRLYVEQSLDSVGRRASAWWNRDNLRPHVVPAAHYISSNQFQVGAAAGMDFALQQTRENSDTWARETKEPRSENHERNLTTAQGIF